METCNARLLLSSYWLSCALVSRLKGMETLGRKGLRWCYTLALPFPVWREWKLDEIKLIGHSVRVACDVRSRLKGMETYLESQRSYMRNQSLGCPFLFEGNGNTLFTLLRSFTLSGPCDVRSRLKGMETASDSPRTHTTKFLLCSAFPFEGNGN